MPIHPTALIDPRAEIDPTADVGPYVVIDGPVHLGPRTRVMAHGYLTGDTRLGADNVVHPGSVIGHEPQDLSYRDAPTGVRIGDRNVFREHIEIHRGTQPESNTVIGNDTFLMSHAHVAHNCVLGDRVIMATGAMLAGHVHVGEAAFISGNCVVHQHVHVGRLVIMRGLARASRDLVPFAIIDDTHTVRGLNRIGLERAGMSAPAIRALSRAFRKLFRVRTNLRTAMAALEAEPTTAEIDELLAFIRGSKRGVSNGPPRRSSGSAAGGDD